MRTACIGTWSLALLLMTSACGPEAEAVEEPPKCGQPEGAACDEPDSWPTWALEDVQPDSPRFGQTYGLDVFEGKVVFVAYLVGWCGYCQSQTVALEKLRTELEADGVDVAFVTVNGVSADNADDQTALTSRCGFPVLQDTADVDAWTSGQGGKDDFFIYAPDGSLAEYLPPSSGTNLGDDADYAALKAKIVAVAAAQ